MVSKKGIVLILLLFILNLTSFSYIYLNTSNVVKSDTQISFHGYSEKNIVKVNLFEFLEPMQILGDNIAYNKAKTKPVFTDVIIKPDKKAQVNYSLKLSKTGVYLVEFINSSTKKVINQSVIMVSNLDLIKVYDGETLDLSLINTKTLKPATADVNLLAYGSAKTIKDVSSLNEKISGLRRIIAIGKDGFAISDIYEKNFAFYNTTKVITDRPIYKTNDTVKYRIFAFSENEGVYEIARNENIKITFRDPSGKEVFKSDVKTDENGGYSGEFKISSDAAIGYYTISTTIGQSESSQGFYVEDYVKPEYKIELTSDKKEYYPDQNAEFNASLKYFNGDPVKNAKVTFYVYFEPYYYFYWGENQELIYSGSVITDKDGNAKLPIKVKKGYDGFFRVQVISIDENQKQMEEEMYVTVYPGKYLIRSNKSYYYINEKTSTTISGSVTDSDGKPMSGDVKYDITYYANNKDNLLKSGTSSLKNGLFEIPVIIKDMKYSYYTLNISYKDEKMSLYLYKNEGDTDYLYDRIKFKDPVIKNKDVYLEVEGLKSNEESVGYFWLVGKEIYDKAQISDLSKNSKLNFKIPEKLFEKNIFIIGLIYTKTGSLYLEKDIYVGKNNLKLNYDLKVSPEKAKPGDMITITIKSPEDGLFNLAVVDEAIFALVDFKYNLLNNLYPTLYEPGVDIGQGMRWYEPYYSKNFKIDKTHKFASYKAGAQVKDNTREYFTDTALWVPVLKSKDGFAEVTFRNPDNLTSWRVTSYGVSEKSKVGQKTANYISTLDFYARPILPLFSIKGDKFKFPVVVYNNTDKDLTQNYKVTLDSSILTVAPTEGKVTIPAKGNKLLTFEAAAVQEGSMNIKFAFTSDTISDAVKLPYTIKPDTLKTETVNLVNVDGTKTFEKGTYIRKFSLENVINETLSYLIHYPYGCTEQTLSALYPAIIAKMNGYNVENLDDIITKSLQRLYKHQHDDGGWGWWINDSSTTWLTAYVLEGLYYTKKAGYNIPDDYISKGINYLKKNFKEGYAVYVLNLYGTKVSGFTPKTTYDKVTLAFNDESAYNEVQKLIKKRGDVSYISYKDPEYYHTETELNGLLLKLLITKNADTGTLLEVFKYLMAVKDSNCWYSTRDTARILLSLIDLRDKLGFDNSLDISSSFVYLDTDKALTGKGLVEVKKEEFSKFEKSSEGIKLTKDIFKRFQIPGTYRETEESTKINNYILDVFLKPDVKNIPLSVDFTGLMPKTINKEFKWVINSGLQTIQSGNTKIFLDSEKITINKDSAKLANIRYIRLYNGVIYILSGRDLYGYNLKYSAYKKLKEGMDDFAILNDKFVYLSYDGNENKSKIIFEDREVPVDGEITSIDDLNNKLYVMKEDGTYILNGDTLKKEVETTGYYKLLNITPTELKVFGDISFTGNKDFIGNTGNYTIKYGENTEPGLMLGDIIKITLNFDADTGAYMVFEDFLPGYAQVLKNYKEKDMKNENYYSYFWYRAWDDWYSAKEIRYDRIGFFQNGFTFGTVQYYLKLTNSGEYLLPPAKAYTMYWKGFSGNTDAIKITVK